MEFTIKDFQACCGIVILFATVYSGLFVMLDKAKKDSSSFNAPPAPAEETNAEPS